jgi:hypothetical protein
MNLSQYRAPRLGTIAGNPGSKDLPNDSKSRFTADADQRDAGATGRARKRADCVMQVTHIPRSIAEVRRQIAD